MNQTMATKEKRNLPFYMARFDNDGESWGGFVWSPKGEWTKAPDWDPNPVCGGGLHGQSAEYNGLVTAGTRFVVCITSRQVPIDDDKVKCKLAKIIATNDEAFLMLEKVGLSGISLDLREYPHPLPDGFTHCGGYLDLRWYSHPLPDSFTHCGGHLVLGRYSHPLPSGFTHCGRNLVLEGYSHPLPDGFSHCGGYLVLGRYSHPLPAGFTHCGGHLVLGRYSHPLPAGFTSKNGASLYR